MSTLNSPHGHFTDLRQFDNCKIGRIPDTLAWSTKKGRFKLGVGTMQRVGIGIVGGGSMALVVVAEILFSAAAVVPAKAWNSTDISNALPPLDFTMTRASDGTTVTGARSLANGRTTFAYYSLP